MSATDRVFAALDAGLQRTREPSLVDLRPERCVRCQLHEPAPDGCLCVGCRAWLVADTDADPRRRQASEVESLAAGCGILMDDALAALRSLAAAFADSAVLNVLDRVAAHPDQAAEPVPQRCPRLDLPALPRLPLPPPA